MFGQVQRTQYDLRFPLFGIQVNVHPFFWLLAVVMGWSAQYWEGHEQSHGEYIAIWVACLFVSILIHELGHAIVAKLFGYRPEIFLYTFGGLAAYMPDSRHTTWKSIAISLAGPGAGFLLAGVTYTGFLIVSKPNILIDQHLNFVITQMLFINIIWGLVNLLPVIPLDGGRICEAVLDNFMRYKSQEWAAIIGMVVAGLVALGFFTIHQTYPGFLFAYLCYINFNNYQSAKRGTW